jgi:hypothetical protein
MKIYVPLTAQSDLTYLVRSCPQQPPSIHLTNWYFTTMNLNKFYIIHNQTSTHPKSVFSILIPSCPLSSLFSIKPHPIHHPLKPHLLSERNLPKTANLDRLNHVPSTFLARCSEMRYATDEARHFWPQPTFITHPHTSSSTQVPEYLPPVLKYLSYCEVHFHSSFSIGFTALR